MKARDDGRSEIRDREASTGVENARDGSSRLLFLAPGPIANYPQLGRAGIGEKDDGSGVQMLNQDASS